MVTDTENRIVQVNAALEAITGYESLRFWANDPKILKVGAS